MSIESPHHRQKTDVNTPTATEVAQAVFPEAKNREGFTKGQKIAGTALALSVLVGGGVAANHFSSQGEIVTSNSSDDTEGKSNTPEVIPNVSPSNITPLETASPSAEVKAGDMSGDMKFYIDDGEEFQTFEDIQRAAEFDVKEIPKVTDTIPLVIDRIQDVANYRPTEKTVRASVNKPTEQLEREDYELVMEQYRLAHDVMFASTSGDFYDTLKEVCQQGAFNYLLTIDEEQPYAVELTLHANKTELRITDNSSLNTIDDNQAPYLGNYRLMSSSNGRDVTSDNGKWKVSGGMELLKQAQ